MSEARMNVPLEHELKVNVSSFDLIRSNPKSGEVRDCTDRNFSVGETVFLREIDDSRSYTGRTARMLISNVQTYPGLPSNLVVLCYEDIDSNAPVSSNETDDNLLIDLIKDKDQTIMLYSNCLFDILVSSGLISSGQKPSDLQLIQLGIELRDKMNSE